MHILLIHQYFLSDGEGGGSRWNETVRIWKHKGHEITVFAGNRHYLKNTGKQQTSAGYKTMRNIDGISVISCPIYIFSSKVFFIQRLMEYLSFSLSVMRYGIFHWRRKPDVIIATSPPLTVALAAIVLSWWKRCSYIAEVRDLWPDFAIDMGILKNKSLIRLAYKLEQVFYRHAQLIVVLTPAFRKILIEQKRIAEEKLLYIPNAIDFSLSEKVICEFDKSSLQRELSLEGKFVIIYVGAHGRANGLEILLTVAQRLGDLPVIFLLIGEGEQKNYLKNEIVQREINNIKMLDLMPKEVVLRYILLADMGLTVLQKNPTFKTIYSNKTFDYFSCRRPVLMAVDGLSRSLIEEANAGMYIDSENIDSWVSAIKFYIEHPEIVKRQGENGYSYAKMNFDRNQWAEVYLARIKKLLNDGELQNH